MPSIRKTKKRLKRRIETLQGINVPKCWKNYHWEYVKGTNHPYVKLLEQELEDLKRKKQ